MADQEIFIQNPSPASNELAPHFPSPLDLLSRDSEKCLDGRIHRTNSYPTAGGTSADIWEGLLGDQKVAIKRLRYFSRRINEEPGLLRVCHL
jgi:hypothetical protein